MKLFVTLLHAQQHQMSTRVPVAGKKRMVAANKKTIYAKRFPRVLYMDGLV